MVFLDHQHYEHVFDTKCSNQKSLLHFIVRVCVCWARICQILCTVCQGKKQRQSLSPSLCLSLSLALPSAVWAYLMLLDFLCISQGLSRGGGRRWWKSGGGAAADASHCGGGGAAPPEPTCFSRGWGSEDLGSYSKFDTSNVRSLFWLDCRSRGICCWKTTMSYLSHLFLLFSSSKRFWETKKGMMRRKSLHQEKFNWVFSFLSFRETLLFFSS